MITGAINPLQAHACNCIGPQGGDPVCPCAMPAYQRRQQGERAIEILAKQEARGLAATKPVAYLIRMRDRLSSAGGTIKSGTMFKTRAAADRAAMRLTNRWRTCEVVPVMEVK